MCHFTLRESNSGNALLDIFDQKWLFAILSWAFCMTSQMSFGCVFLHAVYRGERSNLFMVVLECVVSFCLGQQAHEMGPLLKWFANLFVVVVVEKVSAQKKLLVELAVVLKALGQQSHNCESDKSMLREHWYFSLSRGYDLTIIGGYWWNKSMYIKALAYATISMGKLKSWILQMCIVKTTKNTTAFERDQQVKIP